MTGTNQTTLNRSIFEPRHDKTKKKACAPSEDSDQPGHPPCEQSFLLCALWIAKNPSFIHADSEDSDQTGQMPRLIWVFAGRTCHFVGFVMRQLIYSKQAQSLAILNHFSCVARQVSINLSMMHAYHRVTKLISELRKKHVPIYQNLECQRRYVSFVYNLCQEH